MDEMRPLALFGHLPFIIAVGRDQAAPSFDRVLEGRFFQQRFGARIDQQSEFTGILDPGRQQAPAHQSKMPDAVLDNDHRYRLSRSDIIPWREIRLIEIAENLPQGRRRRGDYEADRKSTRLNS